MLKNYEIYTNEENEKVLNENGTMILEDIIRHYNNCDSDYIEFAKDVISTLEEWFDYGY
ncbi:MAG: hypothetical protein PHE29_08240 [Tissierellia bacterium]|nr:hypothetical protein [Tissierellia bacterium]MDD4779054.1 hypothetical protein [Tissierellia bacterium]